MNAVSTPPSVSPGADVLVGGGRLDYLDGVRGFAALYVMFAHGVWPFLFYPSKSFFLPALAVLSGYAHLFVDVFLVLSGFSLMLPVVRPGVLKKGTWDFYRRRARRILPPYFAVMAIALTGNLGIQALSHDHGLRFTPTGLFVNALMLQDVLPQYSHELDPAAWTVAVEWKIYFLFPLLVWLMRRAGPAAVLLATGTLAGLLMLLWQWCAPTVALNLTCPWYVALFGVGVCACWASTRPGLTRGLWVLGAAALAALIALYVVPPAALSRPPSVILALVDLSAGVAAACALALWRHRPPALLTWRPLVRVGTFAYSLYLLHMPLMIWWTTFLKPDLLAHLARRGLVAHVPGLSRALTALAAQTRSLHFQLPALFLVGFPLTVALAYVFFLACERPFLNVRRHETMAETARDAALSPAI